METIGSGAMGVVWRARDERLERVIAIKQLIIRPGLTPAKTEEARRRAMREARIAARLHHRNAVALLDVAEHDGDPCLVMEFVNARSLSAVIAERGTLPPEQVAAIGSQVAAALAAAHAAGIVHRDVKPGNILLDDQGTVKITDFGISKATGDHTITTDTGVLAGTPAYLAPELARGQQPTTASDVFSLGSTLYHALEGTPPFGLNPNPLALLHAVANGDVKPPRNGGQLTSALMTLLRTDPAERPTMDEAATTLAAPTAPMAVPSPTLLERTVPARRPAPPVQQRPASPVRQPTPPAPAPTPAAPPPPRRGVLIGAAAAVAVLAASVVLVLTTQGDKTTANPNTETRTVTVSNPPTETSTTPPSTPNAGAARVTNFSAAGEAVIAFYLSSTPAAQRWALLTPNAQAYFGSKAEFDTYWAQYDYVASEDANQVTVNDDGSANVPVTVILTKDDQESSDRFTVRVVNVAGKHMIDSDPRV
ncbi:serine/threonine protein kinase [Actinokineospora fastidiosa]|uniref:non-specific serine/threonine protein kinase n=2 Tax=Pseudonocardiaceae TaxID=2070 RepID=A0A918G9X5_9PSEU|nr:serine/threonine protein kinase [Actinokineospora fastidiosa]